MKEKQCSFELIEFKKFYGLSYRWPSNDCNYFDLFGSTGSLSYAISGFIYSSCGSDGSKRFVVSGLESFRPKVAFYSSLPDLSRVSDLRLILHGYSLEDSVVTDFCKYLEEKQK